MSYKRLTGKHPLHLEVTKLFELMDQLDLQIHCNGPIYVSNNSGNNAELMDMEQNPRDLNYGFSFPGFDWKLVYEE